jgi:putative transposase
VAAIKKQESRTQTKEACREPRASVKPRFTIGRPNTAAYRCQEVLEDLEAELSQYKKIEAELTFENHAMKSLTQKKSSKPG